MKKLFLITLMVCLSSGVAVAEPTFYYRTYGESGDAEDHWFTLQFREDVEKGPRAASFRHIDGVAIEEEYQLDQDLATIWWKVSAEGHQTEYEGRRVGNKLYLTGTLDGKPLAKEVEIDDKPFYYNPKIGLMRFARSKAPKHEFWGLQNRALTSYRLVAENKGIETISVNGKSVEAAKVQWKAKRVPAFLFNRTYWFRTSDYMYVKQKERKGVRRELIKVE